MALTNTPVWPQTPRTALANVTTANVATDGSGPITPLVTAGSDGSRLTGLVAGGVGTVTATAVRFFLSKNSGSTWSYLPDLDGVVPAHTLDTTTANGAVITLIDRASSTDYIDLEAGDMLGCAIGVSQAAGIRFSALATDY